MKIIFIIPRLRSSGPTTQLGYILDSFLQGSRQEFIQLELITLRKESANSDLKKFKSLPNLKITLSSNLREFITTIIYIYKMRDGVIISSGIFAELVCYLFAPRKSWLSVIRSYPPEDFRDKLGLVLGILLSSISMNLHKKSTRCIAVSKSLRHRLAKKGLKAITIQNAVLPVPIMDVENIKVVSNTFLIVGNLRTLKNVDAGIQLFLKCRMPEDELIVLGDGPIKKDLQEKYKKNSKINFYGYVDDVTNFLTDAKCLISLSKSEGMPNSVMESLSWGVPCILSPIPAHIELSELISDGIFIYDENKDKNEGLNKIISDFLYQTRFKKVDISRKTNDVLDPVRLSGQYIDVIKQVLNEV